MTTEPMTGPRFGPPARPRPTSDEEPAALRGAEARVGLAALHPDIAAVFTGTDDEVADLVRRRAEARFGAGVDADGKPRTPLPSP